MGEAARGHVFVINGALAELDCDAVLISTSYEFGIGEHWASTLGPDWVAFEDDFRHRVRELMPDDWQRLGYGRARRSITPIARPTWFIDVAIDSPLNRADDLRSSIQKVMEHLRRAFDEVDASDVESTKRLRPLVALPVLGVGRGGFASIAGDVIDLQLRVCQEAVDRLGIDVVIVAASPSDFSAFQARRRRLVEDAGLRFGLTPDLDSAASDLSRRARAHELALFLGAGVSMSAGLPSWGDLLEHLTVQAGARLDGIATDKLHSTDHAELLQSVLEPEEFREAILDSVRSSRYGLAHACLASLGCREVVTTNYDGLYEKAASHGSESAIPVLPWVATKADRPWLLKMHGDVGHDDTLVLTRSDFVHYDAASRPMASLVQGLMVTKHLLIVGASLDDDNFLRLAHEVKRFRKDKLIGRVGTVLTLTPMPAKKLIWSEFFEFVAVSGEGTENSAAARALSIFLDRLSMLATPNRHLLDKRYDALLSEAERAAALELRNFHDTHGAVLAGSPEWRGLLDAFAGLGVEGRQSFTSSGSPASTPHSFEPK